MPNFAYKCLNESGQKVSGTIIADSLEAANDLLANKDFVPLSVKKIRSSQGSGKSSHSNVSISNADLILFTKQLRTMLNTGMSILDVLNILSEQTENAGLKSVLAAMADDLNSGSALHHAFRKHPKVFSQLYCSMVRAGEVSGTLPEILDRLSYIIEHEYKIKKSIKSALQYPMIVTAFLGVAFFVLLTFVLPKFTAVFEKAGVELPLPTRICLFLYQMISEYWFVSLGIIVVVWVALHFYLKTEDGRCRKDAMLLGLPIIGNVLIKAANSRFASIFAILQKSGVGILDSMKILAGTIGNYAIAKDFELIESQLEEGRGISEPLKNSRYFTPILVSMVATGEKSGNLEDMLEAISEHYDTEVEFATKNMADAIVPILTVGLAVIVGFFALAIFMPMWDMTKTF